MKLRHIIASIFFFFMIGGREVPAECISGDWVEIDHCGPAYDKGFGAYVIEGDMKFFADWCGDNCSVNCKGNCPNTGNVSFPGDEPHQPCHVEGSTTYKFVCDDEEQRIKIEENLGDCQE